MPDRPPARRGRRDRPSGHETPHGETAYSPASLLRALASNPLDVEQLRGTDLPHEESAPPDTWPVRALTLVLAVALGFGTTAAVLALRQSADPQHSPRAAIEQEIQERRAVIDDLSDHNDTARQEITQLQEQVLDPVADGGPAQQDAYDVATGADAVSGPGLVLTLEDSAPLPESAGDAAGTVNRVTDSDLQIVVNGLWAAGAEAVAVNGQRVTASTAIRTAGDAILVDFRALSPPYEVSVVGDPDTLRTEFENGAAGGYVEQIGSAYAIGHHWSRSTHLQLPGRGVPVLREASTKEHG